MHPLKPADVLHKFTCKGDTLNSGILISGDPSQLFWNKKALEYLPKDVKKRESKNLTIVGVGELGGCRLPKHYREREIILLSDWIFPPPSHSEGDETGKFLIITLLHEIAHAVLRHKSPKNDKLSPEEDEYQETEADSTAIDWYNQHIESIDNEYLTRIEAATYRELVKIFSKLYFAIGQYKWNWHQNCGA